MLTGFPTGEFLREPARNYPLVSDIIRPARNLNQQAVRRWLPGFISISPMLFPRWPLRLRFKGQVEMHFRWEKRMMEPAQFLLFSVSIPALQKGSVSPLQDQTETSDFQDSEFRRRTHSCFTARLDSSKDPAATRALLSTGLFSAPGCRPHHPTEQRHIIIVVNSRDNPAHSCVVRIYAVSSILGIIVSSMLGNET